MRIVTNSKLAGRLRKIAQYLFFVTFAIPLLGLFLINTQTDDVTLALILPSVVLIVALVITMISVRLANLWIRQPHPDEVITESLKGIGKSAVLYHYFHFPARHVLVAPQGVFAMVTRYQDGEFRVEGDKWTRFQRGGLARIFNLLRFDSLGDPNRDAREAAAHVKRLLEPIAPDVEVHPLIVFVDPRVDVEMIDPAVPVVFPEVSKLKPSIKDHIWSIGRGRYKTLTPEQIEAFEAATVFK